MNPHFVRVALVFAVLFAALLGGAAPAQADGLVQVRLSGALAGGDEGGSHLVEVEVVQGEIALYLHVHLASGTTGGELAQLLAARLEASGVAPTLALTKDGTEGSVWIDAATSVALRLGRGLQGEVACAEGAPRMIRVDPPATVDEDLVIRVAASSAIPRANRPPLRRRAKLDVPIGASTGAPEITTALWEAASETWMTERNGGIGWSPIKMLDGGVLTGLSVRLDSEADWRLEVDV